MASYRSEDNTKFTADKKRKCTKSNKTAAAHPCPAFLNNRAMEGEESRVKELGMGQLAFFGHLERVERMRCYWELKHVQLKTLEQGVKQLFHKQTSDADSEDAVGVPEIHCPH